MSVIEPDDDDFFRALEEQMGAVEVGDVLDVSKIPSPELGIMVKECDKLLADMGQLHVATPTTQSAREVHSKRAALLIEMAKRGLR